jgi:hypothetical protein
MSTYSTSRRVNEYDHPLDRRLRGYCRSLVPRVPWAAGCGKKKLDMTWLPLAIEGLGAMHPILDMVPPLVAEGEGPPT